MKPVVHLYAVRKFSSFFTDKKLNSFLSSGVPRNFFQGGVQQIQLRTEDRENRDLGAVAP